jgi:hypothetical protein
MSEHPYLSEREGDALVRVRLDGLDAAEAGARLP